MNPFKVVEETPVVDTCAVASRSAETGGTEPARLTHTTLVGLDTVPDEVSVIELAVDSAWSCATYSVSPATSVANAVVSVVKALAQVDAVV